MFFLRRCDTILKRRSQFPQLVRESFQRVDLADHETSLFRVAAEPLYSVVIGSGRALENIDAMRGLMSLGGEN